MIFLRYAWRLLKWLLVLVLLLALAGFLYVWLHPAFGGKPDAASLARMQASPQFNGAVFENLERTHIDTAKESERRSLLDWLASVSNPPPGKQPAEPLPSVPLDVAALTDQHFAWLGHATVLMNLGGQILLTDPVFHRASPIALGGAPFATTHTYSAAQMPALDAVLISHDHYDHLDHRAIQQLNAQTAHFYVPLGVKAHLQRWGVADEKITELDWHESAQLGDVHLTLAPSRHFSGRNFHNRFSTLWGAWVIRAPGMAVYFSGDSGAGQHFADTARRYGPFDIAFMESGSYNQNWAHIHMTPEQSVAAAQTLPARWAVPIHWAKFDLAYHPWREPIRRFTAEAVRRGQPLITPGLGQVFGLHNPPQEAWWETLK